MLPSCGTAVPTVGSTLSVPDFTSNPDHFEVNLNSWVEFCLTQCSIRLCSTKDRHSCQARAATVFIEKGELTPEGLVSGLGDRESKHLMRDAGTLCPEGRSRITSRVSPAACWEWGEDTEPGQARASVETVRRNGWVTRQQGWFPRFGEL